ncbi:MAG: ABC transporter permease [Saprospiraceae bacterium]|nr:ABC transporter permease [Saprospiraceae bacterium]
MIGNYLKIAVRTLWKNKGIAAINVVSLSVGLACFSLFLLHAVDEFNFDRFHTKADRIFRVYEDIQSGIAGDAAVKGFFMPSPLGPALESDLPEVKAFMRFRSWGKPFVRTPKGVVNEKVDFADAAILSMFNFPLLYGDAKTALAEPNGVVLTERKALQLFGESNPMGKILDIQLEQDFEPFVVAGVLKDLPGNSSLKFDVLLPFERFVMTDQGKRSEGNWNRSSMLTFIELQSGSGLSQNKDRLTQFYQKYHPDVEKNLRQKGVWTKPGAPISFGLQPLLNMRTDVYGDDNELSNPQKTMILLGIAAMILLIACINFTTLAIGRSAGRAREIGVRKVIGANRRQLSLQFMTEALLLSVCSMALGAAIAWGLLPVFNELADKELAFDFQQFPELWWLLPGVTLLSGVLAGIYPALVLSGFSPMETLKSKFKVGGENWFTRSLVSFQFVLSIGLMTCTFVMLRQLDFLQSKNPGFDKENVVVVNAEGVTNPEKTLERFYQRVADRTGILGVSGAELSLGAEAGWSRSGFDYKNKEINIYEYFVDPDYLKVLGLKLLAGRNFDLRFASDTLTGVIVNEAAVREFGWTVETAVGQVMTGYFEEEPEKNPVVIGVVKDYNFRSLHQQVEPMMFHMFSSYQPMQFFVRIAPGDPGKAIAELSQAWAVVEPLLPFRYNFLDDNLDTFYKSDQRWSHIVSIAGGISICLACLGLFGLAALAVVNRTKEIGIRKVLGASVPGISNLLAKDFLKLVFIAIVIASPLAYWAMDRWLSDFAYRIEIQWWMFVLTGFAAVMIAFLTVSLQSVRAALANPVKSLRSE